MKKILYFSILILSIFSCTNKNETKSLSTFLQIYSEDIKNYKVICFIPSDGCTSCIYPSVDYSKKAGKDFLLVLSSRFKKSINYIKEFKQIEESKSISDSLNLAERSGFVSQVSPSFYFLKNGHIVKIVDLSNTLDKTSILKEVEKFLSK